MQQHYDVMNDSDPAIIDSPLSRTVFRDGISVEVNIFRIEGDPYWALEVVNETGTSIVWDEVFATDEAAFRAFVETVEGEGMMIFLDQGNAPGSSTSH